MPYKDKEKQKEYQRKWLAKRKADWLKEKGPCVKCSSNENLELDHIDRNEKETHRIWSWNESRRQKELERCQVLCKLCHDKKTREQSKYFSYLNGARKHNSLITENDAIKIRSLEGEMTQKDIAYYFGISRQTVSHIIERRKWKHV